MARRAILPIFIPHLGCPNDCVFCNQRRISGSLVPSTAQDVTELLQKACADGVKGAELAYYGGSFTATVPEMQEELLAAAQPFLMNGTISSIRLSTRPDAIDENVVLRLRRFGVGTVELGTQSMDDAVLYEAGRGHTAADTVHAFYLLRQAGFSVILQMMTGLPGADAASDVRTAEKIIALHPDGVRIYPTVIIRDTPLEDLWRAGQYKEHTVADAVQVCADILPVMEAAGIPVIRLGLNPTEDLSGGDAVAGAYHPAMGELVRSEILLRRARVLISAAAPAAGAQLTLVTASNRLSAMIGQHRRNIQILTEEFSLKRLKVISGDVQGNEIRLKTQ